MKSQLPEFETIPITLSKVRGIDSEIKKVLDSLAYVPDFSIDTDAWHNISAKMLYYRLPMFVVRRKDEKFDVVGDGRTLLLAQILFKEGETFPALCLTGKRISIETKLTLLATEAFGLASLYRTRRHLPKRSLALWEALNSRGILTIMGDGPKAFSHGSGYSLSSLLDNKADIPEASFTAPPN